MPDSNFLLDRQQIEIFKNWIRFISEPPHDFYQMPAAFTLAWSAALKELSESVRHEIVPFHREKR